MIVSQRPRAQPLEVGGSSVPYRAQRNNLNGSRKSTAVAGADIPLSSMSKSLRVIRDSKLSVDNQVPAECKACSFHVHALRQVKGHLYQTKSQTL